MASTAHSNSSPERRRGRLWRWLARLLGAILAAIFLLHVVLFAQILWWHTHDPHSTAFMRQSLERLREKNPKAQLRHQWVPYDQISVHLKRAVVAAEDQKFLDHEGFDWEELEKAFEANQRRGRIRRGGSTISQQLAKNLFLTPQRSYLRKGEEAVLTGMIEIALDKRRILEIYLNVIEWGDGLFGAEAAARHYYGVSAAQLSPEQAVRLAAMIPNPRFYYRRVITPYLERRADILLVQLNWIRVP